MKHDRDMLRWFAALATNVAMAVVLLTSIGWLSMAATVIVGCCFSLLNVFSPDQTPPFGARTGPGFAWSMLRKFGDEGWWHPLLRTMNVPNQHQIDRLCEASTAQLRASVQQGENLQAAVAAFVADAHRTGMCPSEIVDYFCVSTPSMLDLAGVTGQQRDDAVKALDESIAKYLWH